MCVACSAYCMLIVACGAPAVYAQSSDVKISVTSLSPPRVVVEGTRQAATSTWSFRNSYAGVVGIGDRVSNLSLSDRNGANVEVRKDAPGEYKSNRDAVHYRYEVNLSPPAAATSASHVSWLTSENGVLMLGDLLPLSAIHNVRVRLVLPGNWKAISAETKAGDKEYIVADAEQGIIYIARELREQRTRVNGITFVLGATGAWAFSDSEASDLMRDIINEHQRVTGGEPKGDALIVLAPFPSVASPFTWSAETRGRTVFLLSGNVPSKTAALAHLSVPLAHELFHLWVPHGLSLSGEYDWFYEGWTLYQAMRVGMTLGYLNFQDYLNALGRAFDGYHALKYRTQLSLIDLSKRRWTNGQGLIYNKGMLTAFLFDLTLRHRTRGKRSVANIYRELFEGYSSKNDSATGNDVIIKLLNRNLGSADFTKLYIESPTDVDLLSALQSFGLEVRQTGARTHINVAKSLTKQQHDLLRGLGYNARVDTVTRGNRGQQWQETAYANRSCVAVTGAAENSFLLSRILATQKPFSANRSSQKSADELHKASLGCRSNFTR